MAATITRKTSSGKIMRQACRTRFHRGELKIIASWQRMGDAPLPKAATAEPRSPEEEWAAAPSTVPIDPMSEESPVAVADRESLDVVVDLHAEKPVSEPELSDTAGKPGQDPALTQAPLMSKLALQRWIAAWVARRLKLEETAIDVRVPLADLGLYSMGGRRAGVGARGSDRPQGASDRWVVCGVCLWPG